MVTTAEIAMTPGPIIATDFFDMRGPKMMSTNAPAKGRAGMSHNQWNTLTPHLADGVGVYRFVLVIDLQQQRQTYRNFRRSHRKNKNEHHLAVRLRPARARHHEGQAGRVEHDLNRHQYEHQVTAYQQADQPQREQDPRQQQPLVHGNNCHFLSPSFDAAAHPGDKRPRALPKAKMKPAPRPSDKDRRAPTRLPVAPLRSRRPAVPRREPR